MKKLTVPTGQFIIKERDSNTQVEALLGVCLGVSLVDKKRGIGGLSHFLLPFPSESRSSLAPQYFVSTGLPLFVEEMLQKGAKRHNLEATVAGGAMLDPQEDLELNLGEKSKDIAFSYLRDMEIPIRFSETGGYNGWKLVLRLRDLQSKIIPLLDLSKNKDLMDTDHIPKPSGDEINTRLGKISSIPQITLKVIHMLSDEKYDIKQITKELKQDQVLVARVLRFCNSTYMGIPRRIDSIERAILIIGERLLLKVILMASLEPIMQKNDGYSLCEGGLFHHSIKTGKAAEILSHLLGSVRADVAYTAGLLHDIGKVVLDQYMSRYRPQFYRELENRKPDLSSIEQDIFGIDHAQAGKILAKRWNLSPNIIDVIENHHFPENARVDSYLAHLIYLSDLLVNRLNPHLELDHINTTDLPQRLERLGLEKGDLIRLLEHLHLHIDS